MKRLVKPNAQTRKTALLLLLVPALVMPEPVRAQDEQDPILYVGRVTSFEGEAVTEGLAVENHVEFVVSGAGEGLSVGGEILLVFEGDFSFTSVPDPFCFKFSADFRTAHIPIDELLEFSADIEVSAGFADSTCAAAVFDLEVISLHFEGSFNGDRSFLTAKLFLEDGAAEMVATGVPGDPTGGADAGDENSPGQVDEVSTPLQEEEVVGPMLDIVDRSRFDERLVDAALEDLQCGGALTRCDQARRRAEVFADRFGAVFTDEQLLADLQAVVLLGNLRHPDGTLALPGLNHLFPTIARLAISAQAGDSNAREALLQLVELTLVLDEEAS